MASALPAWLYHDHDRDDHVAVFLTVSFVLQEGIAREGAPLFLNEKEVGSVTSGTFSPCLKQGIGLGLVTDNPDHVMIRVKKMPVKLVTLPFV